MEVFFSLRAVLKIRQDLGNFTVNEQYSQPILFVVFYNYYLILILNTFCSSFANYEVKDSTSFVRCSLNSPLRNKIQIALSLSYVHILNQPIRILR